MPAPIPYFDAVWSWDNSASAYVNNTIEARSSGGTAFSILADTPDRLYLRGTERFDLATFELAVAGAGLGTLTYEYSSTLTGGVVTGWTQFVPLINYTFDGTGGAERFSTLSLTGWVSGTFNATNPHAAAPPDSTAGYWIRIYSSAVTTAPTVNRIKKRAYPAYAIAADVQNQLSISTAFSSSTIPSLITVEDYLHAAASYIDMKAWKSWRPNIAVREEHDFNIAGFKLRHRFPSSVLTLEVWNGSDYDLKTQGRSSDYFLVPDIGMVYFARYFLLPARMSSYTAPIWGWGEFAHSVRITYLYGRDIHEDELWGGTVWDIAKKLAAIDIVQNTDFQTWTVSGADKISLDRKIENWKMEVEDKLDTMRGMIVF